MITTKLRFVNEEKLDESPEGIRKRKQNLRAYMKERRGQNENRDVKEKLLIDNFLKTVFCETEGACTRRNVFIYLSFSSEAPTDGLIECLLKKGYKVYCPRMEDKEMYAVEYGEDFTLSSYGIREPIGQAFDGEIDIIVLPLLAADEEGNRLGYGGGYYDRYLRKNPKAKKIGYCYDFQICKNLPVEETDERMDILVTDKRVINIKK